MMVLNCSYSLPTNALHKFDLLTDKEKNNFYYASHSEKTNQPYHS